MRPRTTYRICAMCGKPFQAEFEYTDGDVQGMIFIETRCKRCREIEQPDLYVKIHMINGGTYVQKLNQLGVLIEEIHEAARCSDIGCRWELELVEMTREQYDALGDFKGH